MKLQNREIHKLKKYIQIWQLRYSINNFHLMNREILTDSDCTTKSQQTLLHVIEGSLLKHLLSTPIRIRRPVVKDSYIRVHHRETLHVTSWSSNFRYKAHVSCTPKTLNGWFRIRRQQSESTSLIFIMILCFVFDFYVKARNAGCRERDQITGLE